MSHHIRWLSGLAGVCVVASLAGCSRPRTLAPLKSPDGTMTLVPGVNASHADPVTYGCVQFTIQDAHGKVLHREQTHAADRMRWSLAWSGNDKVILNSSDIGTSAWQRRADGKWQPVTQ